MIQPGLERIGQLLRNVQFPWKAIHVAGTNGKGSICHHASALLKHRHVRVGKFTSPHLIDRWDCISINDSPVDAANFLDVERYYQQLNEKQHINASPFEILTATAFTVFNNEKVDVGVVEVGMGGKLDATNILNNQVVSVITKIARDHEGFLGNTVEEIAKHKAGILRPSVPYIVNPTNEANVKDVIVNFAKEIGAGPQLSGNSTEMKESLYSTHAWRRFAKSLPSFQLDNAVLAIVAVKETLKSLGMPIEDEYIEQQLANSLRNTNPGRLHYTSVPPVFGSADDAGRTILVDGAHNPDAAKVLEDFILRRERRRTAQGKQAPPTGWPVTWVLAMTEGKDAQDYLRRLLHPGDNVVTTTFDPVDGMPWVKPMDPVVLLEYARLAQPDITGIAMSQSGALRALCAAKYLSEDDHPIVLTGSLYLVGNFLRDMRPSRVEGWWSDPAHEIDRAATEAMHKQERGRVNRLRSGQNPDSPGLVASEDDQSKREQMLAEERRKIQEEIEALDEEIQLLEAEEHLISPKDSEISLLPSATAIPIIDRITQSSKSHNSSAPLSPQETLFARFEEIRQSLEALPRLPNAHADESGTPTKIAELRGRIKQLKSNTDVDADPERGLEKEPPTAQGPNIRLHYSTTKDDPRHNRRTATDRGQESGN